MEHLSEFITRHWELSLAFIVILILTLINEWLTHKKKAKELTPQAAIDLINNENAVVFDLRDQDSFQKGHIISAIRCTIDDFKQPKMSKYKSKPIILVCAKGLQAPAIAAQIKLDGFQPMVLSGGIVSWQNADLPLIKDKG